MKQPNIYLKALTNVLLYTIAIILIIVFVPKLVVFFLPFVIGWIISAIANPAVKFFEEKIRFKRKASSAVMIILILATIISATYGIVVFFVNQAIGFVESIPENWDNWQNTFENFGANFNHLFRNLPDELRNPLNELGGSLQGALGEFVKNLASAEHGSSLISNISSKLGNAAGILIGIIMSILSAYFFTAEHNFLADKMEKFIPKSIYSKFLAAYRGLKKAIGGYFKAQIKIEMWVYCIIVIGLLIIRIDYAFIIALLIAILDFLPFFGAGLIMVPWSIIAFADKQYFIAIGMLITWAIGQLIRQIIQPKIVGDQVGVPALPTLILLFIGYKAMGVFGMVIAVPIAMIVISLYEEGVFLTYVRSLKILWSGLAIFRKLPEEEKKE